MKKVIAGAIALLPAVTFGATPIPTSGIVDTIKGLTDVVNALIPFFLAIAVVVFIYGVIKYIFQPGEESRKEARSYIIWGIIAMAVILAIFGLAKLVLNLVGVTPDSGPGSVIQIPKS